MSVFEKVSDNFSTFNNLAQPLFMKAKYKIDDNINMHSYSLLYEKYLGFKWFLSTKNTPKLKKMWKKEAKETLPSGKLLCLEFEILSTFYMVLYAIPVKMLSDLIQLNQLCIHFRMENILTAKATAMENKTQGLTFLLLDL